MAESIMFCKRSEMTFESKTPTFFTVIFEPPEPDQLLRIPKKCLAKLGDVLPKMVELKIPNGDVWKVEYRKDDHNFWMPRGWKRFADLYSIKHPYCLVFKYDGQKGFDLNILYRNIRDRTAFEIEYPPISEELDSFSKENVGESYDVMSTEILEDVRPNKKTLVSQELSANKDHKKSVVEEEIGSSKEIQKKDSAIVARQGDDDEELIALHKAATFEPENPFFVVFMGASMVHNPCRMRMPMQFCERYIDKTEGKVTLEDSNGIAWMLDYSIQQFGKKRVAKLFGKWNNFVRHNKLKVGDVCAFELIQSTDIVLKVVILFRSSPSSATRTRRHLFGIEYLIENENSKTIRRACMFISKNPSFIVSLKDAHIRPGYLLTIPRSFSQEYLSKEHEIVNLYISDDKTWQVMLRYSARNAILSGGWKQFAQDNSLRVGDVCVFELTEPSTRLLKVIIYRNSEDASVSMPRGSSQLPGKHKLAEDETRLRVHSKSRKNMFDASSSKARKMRLSNIREISLETSHGRRDAKNPSFVIAMRPTYVSSNASQIPVPTYFGRTYFKELLRLESLNVADGKSWKVCCRETPTLYQPIYWIRGKWKDFVMDSELKVGDVCSFELINNTQVSLLVSISRAREEADNVVLKIEPDT